MGSTYNQPVISVGSIITSNLINELKTQLNNENTRRGYTSSTDVIESTITNNSNITSAIFSDLYSAIEDYRSKSVAGTIATDCACNCNYCTCNCNYCTCNCNVTVNTPSGVGCSCNCNYCPCACQSNIGSCSCNCNYCPCQCNYCVCNCNYCPCACNYYSSCD